MEYSADLVAVNSLIQLSTSNETFKEVGNELESNITLNILSPYASNKRLREESYLEACDIVNSNNTGNKVDETNTKSNGSSKSGHVCVAWNAEEDQVIIRERKKARRGWAIECSKILGKLSKITIFYAYIFLCLSMIFFCFNSLVVVAF